MAFPTGSFQLESREGYKIPRVSGGVTMNLTDRDSVDVGGHFQRSDYAEEPSQFGASLTYRRAF